MANILIVEDEPSIIELIRRNLQLVGHRCLSVFDGPAAVAEIQSSSYDLILLVLQVA